MCLHVPYVYTEHQVQEDIVQLAMCIYCMYGAVGTRRYCVPGNVYVLYVRSSRYKKILCSWQCVCTECIVCGNHVVNNITFQQEFSKLRQKLCSTYSNLKRQCHIYQAFSFKMLQLLNLLFLGSGFLQPLINTKQ